MITNSYRALLVEDDFRTINKDAFEQTSKILFLIVSKPNTQKLLKIIRSHGSFFTARNFKGIRPYPEDSSMMEIAVNDTYHSLTEEQKSKFANMVVDEVEHDCTFGYEQLTYHQIMRQILPENVIVPTGFELIGDIAHFNLNDEQLKYKYIIAEVLMNKNNVIKTVINKTASISNEFRVYPHEHLGGIENTVTRVKEQRCVFNVDVSKVYWNSRLSHCHEIVVEKVKPVDILIDMFCGIGPFAIPAAKKGSLVFANDLNPESIDLLRKNKISNKIGPNLNIYNLDAREFITNLFNSKEKDLMLNKTVHFVLNLPALSVEFLDCLVNTIDITTNAVIHVFAFSSDPESFFVKDVEKRSMEFLQCDTLTVLEGKPMRMVSLSKAYVYLSFEGPRTMVRHQDQATEEPITKSQTL
ncbi:hypothetical protein PCE1_001721 [Barthelona sp. PCE]